MNVSHQQPLVVGLDNALPPPMQLGDPADDTFRGYEVDLLKELARDMCRSLSYRRIAWSQLLDELRSGAIDLICGAATKTPERQRVVDFSKCYLQVSLAVVSHAPFAINDLHACNALGVRAATTAESFLRSKAIAVSHVSESNEELYEALEAGRLDALVDDSPIAAAFARTHRALTVSLLPGTSSCYALMLRKGNSALQDAVDAVLERLEQDGTLQALQRKWGLEPPQNLQREQ
jgi:arginine/lysine/histidine transporter system substrate-binding protein